MYEYTKSAGSTHLTLIPSALLNSCFTDAIPNVTKSYILEKPLEINADTTEDNQILLTIQDYQRELEEKKRALEEKAKSYDEQIAKHIEDENSKKIVKQQMQERITVAVEQFKTETVKIENYIDCFKIEYNRPPTKDEIREYFTEIQKEITSQTLYTFLEKYNDTEHIKNNDNNV